MVSIKETGNGTVQCCLSRDECERLAQVAGEEDWEREIAIQLMAECGLRSDEVPNVSKADIRYSEEGECWFLEVAGKNTSGGDKKKRDAWLPEAVERDISKFARERGLSDNEPLVSVSVSSVQRWVREAASEVADRDENERWEHVTSHDLRRSWATWHLVERPDPVDVRVMMKIGGWSTYSAIEPYLYSPTDSRVAEAMV